MFAAKRIEERKRTSRFNDPISLDCAIHPICILLNLLMQTNQLRSTKFTVSSFTSPLILIIICHQRIQSINTKNQNFSYIFFFFILTLLRQTDCLQQKTITDICRSTKLYHEVGCNCNCTSHSNSEHQLLLLSI